VSNFAHQLADKVDHFNAQGTRETNLFGAALCFGLFSVFLFPVLACWILAFDANVSFWFGRYMFWWTLPVPLFFFFLIWRQMTISRPKRGILIVAWVFPSVLIFVLAGILNSQASHLADRLVSRDCRTFPTLRPVSLSYWRAKAHLETCLSNQTYYMHSKTVLQACPEYQQWYREEEHPEYWDYLHYLEDNYDCCGFCVALPGGVWSFADSHSSKDSCARVIVTVMQSKVIRLTHQLMCMPMLVLFGALVWMYAVRPTFQAYFHSPAWDKMHPHHPPLHHPQHPQQQYYGAINSPPPMAIMPPPMTHSGSGRSLPGGFVPAPLPPGTMRPGSFQTLPPGAMISRGPSAGSLPPGAMVPAGFA